MTQTTLKKKSPEPDMYAHIRHTPRIQLTQHQINIKLQKDREEFFKKPEKIEIITIH